MDLNTNYNNEFTPKPSQRVQAIRPSSRRLIDAKFEGDTTYGQDFRKWPGEKRDLIRNPNEYQPSNAPFDGLSTYKGLLHIFIQINFTIVISRGIIFSFVSMSYITFFSTFNVNYSISKNGICHKFSLRDTFNVFLFSVKIINIR